MSIFGAYLVPLSVLLVSSHTGIGSEVAARLIKCNKDKHVNLILWRVTASMMNPMTRVLLCPEHKMEFGKFVGKDLLKIGMEVISKNVSGDDEDVMDALASLVDENFCKDIKRKLLLAGASVIGK
jgi:hypothetical protein